MRDFASLFFIAIVLAYLLVNFSCFFYVLSSKIHQLWKRRQLLKKAAERSKEYAESISQEKTKIGPKYDGGLEFNKN